MEDQQIAAPVASLPLDEFRQVTIVWMEAGQRDLVHIVHHSQVDAMVAAITRLHYSPGVNPGSGVPAAIVGEIYAAPLAATGPFWWSTPSLEGADIKSQGAVIFSAPNRKLMWCHPDRIAPID